MPKKPRRPCPGKGPRYRRCQNLIDGNEACCPECKPYEKKATKRYDQQRGNSGDRGYDAAWQKVREGKASRNPLCERCLRNGNIHALDVVHHIKPIETHPELRLVMDNLESLCTACHEEEHKGERWGR